MRKLLFIVLISTGLIQVSAQLGGRAVFEFLDFPVSARVSALGGKQISLHDGDINMVYYNPSIIDESMKEHLAMNYVNYFAGINWGNASYMFNHNKIGHWVAGITYLNYGKFTAANEVGLITGEFRASDYVMYMSYARPIDSNFTVGVSIKPVFSQLESYYSIGLATDWAITYNKPEDLFTASLVFRDLGTQIMAYTEKNYEPLPFEIQFGLSKKLKHAPFRLSLLMHNLQRFDFTYDKEEENSTFNNSDFFTSSNEESDFSIFTDKLFRHVIAGVEFLPTKSLVLRFGYNYQRVQEMQIEQKLGGVGFSWGFGLMLKKYQINFSRATYHMSGASTNFSVTANLAAFRGI